MKNIETITIINTKYSLPIITSIYPNILNFTEKDSFEIDLYLERRQSTQLEGITFNEKAENLECIDLKYKIKCNVSNEHLRNR